MAALWKLRNRLGFLLLLTGGLLPAFMFPGKGGKARPASGWILDYEQGRALARQTGKPIFVVFR